MQLLCISILPGKYFLRNFCFNWLKNAAPVRCHAKMDSRTKQAFKNLCNPSEEILKRTSLLSSVVELLAAGSKSFHIWRKHNVWMSGITGWRSVCVCVCILDLYFNSCPQKLTGTIHTSLLSWFYPWAERFWNPSSDFSCILIMYKANIFLKTEWKQIAI